MESIIAETQAARDVAAGALTRGGYWRWTYGDGSWQVFVVVGFEVHPEPWFHEFRPHMSWYMPAGRTWHLRLVAEGPGPGGDG